MKEKSNFVAHTAFTRRFVMKKKSNVVQLATAQPEHVERALCAHAQQVYDAALNSLEGLDPERSEREQVIEVLEDALSQIRTDAEEQLEYLYTVEHALIKQARLKETLAQFLARTQAAIVDWREALGF